MIKSKKTDPILKGLSYVMKKEGFTRKGNNDWYCSNDETIFVVNLQSEYGSHKFINFGIWIKKLANKEYLDSFKRYNKTVDQEFPKHYQCHIYFRPVHFPESIDHIAEAVFHLNDEEITDKEREKYIISWLDSYEIPVLKQCSTIRGIVEALKQDKFGSAAVRKEVNALMV